MDGQHNINVIPGEGENSYSLLYPYDIGTAHNLLQSNKQQQHKAQLQIIPRNWINTLTQSQQILNIISFKNVVFFAELLDWIA